MSLPLGSVFTLSTLSIKGALLSLHTTCFSFLPLSTSFIIHAQSGRFLGLDFNISIVFCCFSVNGARSFKIFLDGGGGGGLGGGGGGMAALDELLDNVGAPMSKIKKFHFLNEGENNKVQQSGSFKIWLFKLFIYSNK